MYHLTLSFCGSLNTIKSYLMQSMTRSYGLGCLWHSLVAFGRLQRCCVTMFAFVAFTIVREHGGRFLSSGMSFWHMRRPCAYVVFALYSKLCQRGVAFQQCSVSLGSPSSLRILSYLFIQLFILSGVGSFYFHWASGLSVTGAIVGGWARGGRGWVAGWQACGCSSALGCIAVAAPWPMGTQTPLAAQALLNYTIILQIYDFL